MIVTEILRSKRFSFKSFGLMLLISAFMLSAGSVFSQDGSPRKERQKKTPEEVAEKRSDRLKDKLSLTNDQHKQVYNIILSQATEMKSVWESTKSEQDKTARREKMKSIRDTYHSQISAVLTSEQQQLWETHKKEMKEKYKGKKHKKGNKNKELK
jgi:Spy/CpxP family protein refolding chaperone